MNEIKYNYRYLARFIIEAVTPLAVGSGEKDIASDSLVMCDINGLPYIPGTAIAGVLKHYIVEKAMTEQNQLMASIAGVLRHYIGKEAMREQDQLMASISRVIGEEKANVYFGRHDSTSPEGRHGSDLIITEARMIGKDGQVVDGLQNIDYSDEFYAHFLELPVRQHVCISNKGTAVAGGKFDNQVVFKGTRFCFEIELLSSNADRKDDFDDIIKALYSGFIRLGGNTRKGFGQIEVRSLKTAVLDLCNPVELDFYCEKTSSLNDEDWKAWSNDYQVENSSQENYDRYELEIRPEDFYLFGSGMGDEEADMTPVKSTYIEWNGEGKPYFCETPCILIPASSVKGAIAHRVAFYYNNYTSHCVDDQMPIEELNALSGSNNPAVRELFGYIGKTEEEQKPGNVFISDIISSNPVDDKILNHVSIDYFTGGAIDGALFSEKVFYDTNKYTLTLLLQKASYSEGVVNALERALMDICRGMLPLGGGVNRGHGYFNGKLFKNGELYGRKSE